MLFPVDRRFSHFEKKMHVYDLIIVEMFKVELRIDPDHLPDWITLDALEDNPSVKVVLWSVSATNNPHNLRSTKISRRPTSPQHNRCDIG